MQSQISVIERITNFLLSNSEESWAAAFLRLSQEVADDPQATKAKILSLYGGMGVRPNGTRLILSIEPHQEGFSVALFTPNQTPAGGWIPQVLMEVIDPFHAQRCLNALNGSLSHLDATHAWWESFLDFLQQHDVEVLSGSLNPMEVEAYEERLKNKLKQLGLDLQ